MTFEEIFQEKGLYKAESFSPGTAFKIDNGPVGLQLTIVTYTQDKIFPYEENIQVYADLFNKDYKRVLNVGQLFKPFNEL